MRRREFLRDSITGAAAGLAISRTRAARAAERPNILWLVSEDNDPWLGCYGDDFAETPNLDRLAAEGVLFTHCFANAPVCAPARFTLHTGVYACSAGAEHMRSQNPIPARLEFFPALLRRAGYYCVNGQKTDYNTTGTPSGTWDSRRLTPSLKGLRNRQPFFRFINFMVTHESSLLKSQPVIHDPARVKLAPYHPDTPEIRHDYAQYYDQITRLDAQIGEVLAALAKEGLADNTIVFYFSDNGGVLPRSKRFLYDSGMRVPLIVRVPPAYQAESSTRPGERSDRLTSYIDFAPTVLSLAGVEIPDHLQGRAFLGRAATAAPDAVFGFRGRMDERYDSSRALHDRDWKYIRNYFPSLPWGRHLDYLWRMPAMQSWEAEYRAGRLNEVQQRFFHEKPFEELYYLPADPFEINNLAADPNRQDTLLRMRQRLTATMLEIHDTGLLPENELRARAHAAGLTAYELARDPARYDLGRLMTAAELAARRDPARLSELRASLTDPDNGVRFWAAVGCSALGEKAASLIPDLEAALADSSSSVVMAAAEALARMGKREAAKAPLQKFLVSRDLYLAAHAADVLDIAGLTDDPSLERQKKKVRSRLSARTGLNALV